MNKLHGQLAPAHKFLIRLARSIIIGLLIVLFALFIGMLGYHILENMTWTDAFVNAAMILSGMGPLSPLLTQSGKIFAGCYALFSGLALIITVGVIISPVIHRFMHQFNLEDDVDIKRKR